MKLLFITPSFYPSTYYGGPSESVYYLASEICKQKSDISVVTTDANGKVNLDIKKNQFFKLENGLNVKYYGNSTSYGFSYRMFFNLYKDIKLSSLIYIVSIFTPSTPLSILLSHFYKKKIILSPRGQLENWSLKHGSKLKKLWLRLFIKPFADKIKWHVTSEKEKLNLLSVFPDASTFVIPSGINLEDYIKIPEIKDRSYYKKYTAGKTFSDVIVSMGRLHSVKGFDILINAFAEIIKTKPDTALFIAGEDYGEKNNLLNLITKLGLEKNTFLVGQIDDKNEKLNYLANADVFALASHNENFGLAIAESLASGTPVVVSKHTPWSEIEIVKVGKWIENTTVSFAAAIEEMLLVKNKNISIRCSHFISEKYSWETIAEKMIKQFEEINNE